MDVFTREAAVEPLQNKNAETVRARELTGDDGNFVVTTDLGNEFATLDRELPAEAVHRTKRPEDRNAIAVVDRGIQTRGQVLLQKKEKQPATEFRVLQDNGQTAASRQWRTRALSEHRRTRRGASTLSTATCSSCGPWTP